MEENKREPLKIRLSTALLILALVVAIGVIIFLVMDRNNTKSGEDNNQVNNSQVNNSQVNNSQANVENNNSQENNSQVSTNDKNNKDNKDKVNNKDNNSSDEKYTKITKEIPKYTAFHVTNVVANKDNTYTLKGVLYKMYTISESKLKESLKKGTIDIQGEKCEISQKQVDGETHYEIYRKSDSEEPFYSLSRQDDGEYIVETMYQIPYIWEKTDNYRQITVSSNMNISNELTDEKISVKKRFKDEKSFDEDGVSPSFRFTFKNGKCTAMEEVLTSM